MREPWKGASRSLAAALGLMLLLVACGNGAEEAQTPEEPGAESDPDQTEPDTEADDETIERDYDPITITFPTGLPEGIWIMGGLSGFEEALDEITDGRISVEVHLGSALGPLTDHGPMLRDGIANITWLMTPLEPGQYPAHQWLAPMAWIFENRPLVGDLQAYAATLEWGFRPEVQEEMLRQGLVPLVPSTSGLANYTHLCNEPARSLAEARGKETRITSEVHGDEARAVGMTPTFIEAAETYEALQRGVIECVLMHPRDLAGFGLLDIAQHVHMDADAAFSGHMTVGLFAHADWWNGLPVQAQRDIWDALEQYVHQQMRASLELDIAFFEDLAERGELHGLEQDFKAALTEWQQGRVEALTANPPSGWSPEEAEASLNAFQEGVDRWLAIVDELGYADAPEAWDEYVASFSAEDLDITAWVDRVWEDILLPQRP